MTAFRVARNYYAVYRSVPVAFAEGAVVDVDDVTADWVNRDSPGCLIPAAVAEPAAEPAAVPVTEEAAEEAAAPDLDAAPPAADDAGVVAEAGADVPAADAEPSTKRGRRASA